MATPLKSCAITLHFVVGREDGVEESYERTFDMDPNALQFHRLSPARKDKLGTLKQGPVTFLSLSGPVLPDKDTGESQ